MSNKTHAPTRLAPLGSLTPGVRGCVGGKGTNLRHLLSAGSSASPQVGTFCSEDPRGGRQALGTSTHLQGAVLIKNPGAPHSPVTVTQSHNQHHQVEKAKAGHKEDKDSAQSSLCSALSSDSSKCTTSLERNRHKLIATETEDSEKRHPGNARVQTHGANRTQG